MFKKHRLRHQSLDGMRPQSSGSQDASRFPTVGMTLPTYNTYNGAASATVKSVIEPNTSRKSQGPSRFSKKRVLLTLLTIILIPGLLLGGKLVYNASKIFGGNLFSALTTSKLKGEDTGRVNILLAGNSVDDPNHAGAALTDSIMILSINTTDNTAFMLSIPRDMWVNVPGYGHHKINEAYDDGESTKFNESNYPKGGMGLLEKVIQQNFGININYYSLINYNAFRQAVDAVGGIDVTIQSTDSRGLYDPNISRVDGGPLKLTNGLHHLDGQTALNLARARGETYRSYGFPGSDFDRTTHQRQMLIALKAKSISSSVIANPVKLNNLMDALGSNVTTDLQLSEVRRLIDIGRKVDNSKIKSLSLNSVDGKNLLANYTSSSGQSALIPAAGLDNFSDIKRYLAKVTSNSPLTKENAGLILLNATNTYGLASKNARTLESKGLYVISLADASGIQSTTQIINNTGTTKPVTLQYLEGIYGQNVTTTNPYAGKYNADFIIVLGNDQLSSATSH